VPDADVEAIRPHVARQVWAMIEPQRLTGMRPGEVILMRGVDLDRSGEVWVYTPDRHKAEHHGRQRTIYLGPRAQAVIQPWLRPNMKEYLFQPREVMAEYRREQRLRRRTPLYPSIQARSPKPNPKYRPGERYSPRTYYHVVNYGCIRAGVPSWSPNQLRHAAATRIREAFDLEAAQVVLGHARADVTQVYAERDLKKAREVMATVG
jgi:integrase